MPTYDGLLDRNLVGFLSSKRVRKTLVKQGLVTITQITKTGVVLDSRRGRLLPSSSSDLLAVKERFVQSMSPERVLNKKKFKKQEIKPMTSEQLKQVIQTHQPQTQEELTTKPLPKTTAREEGKTSDKAQEEGKTTNKAQEVGKTSTKAQEEVKTTKPAREEGKTSTKTLEEVKTETLVAKEKTGDLEEAGEEVPSEVEEAD
jgi:hypothetical protein